MASGFGKAFQEARRKAKEEGRDPDKEVFEFGGKKFKAEMAKSTPSRKMSGEEFVKKYEESDTPAGRTTKTETEVTMKPRRAGQGLSQIRSMMGSDDDEESPAMRRIRMAREAAKSKGPSARGSAVKNMSMAERRMQSAGRAMRTGGSVKKMAGGGMASSASRRADGIAKKGKTRCKMI